MSGKNIKLRKINNSDSPYFIKWWKDSELVELTSGVYEEDDDVLEGYFLSMLNSVRDKHYIIEFNSKVVGNISLTRKDRNTFEVHIVIGEKKFRGKGIGAGSIKKILKIAFNELGYTKAYIEVRPENQRAIVLYELCGFKKTGLKKYPKNKNQPVVLKMELRKKEFLDRQRKLI
jgi:diamine N-acetyltransferase